MMQSLTARTSRRALSCRELTFSTKKGKTPREESWWGRGSGRRGGGEEVEGGEGGRGSGRGGGEEEVEGEREREWEGRGRMEQSQTEMIDTTTCTYMVKS